LQGRESGRDSGRHEHPHEPDAAATVAEPTAAAPEPPPRAAHSPPSPPERASLKAVPAAPLDDGAGVGAPAAAPEASTSEGGDNPMLPVQRWLSQQLTAVFNKDGDKEAEPPGAVAVSAAAPSAA
jgi:hypothetical protein